MGVKLSCFISQVFYFWGNYTVNKDGDRFTDRRTCFCWDTVSRQPPSRLVISTQHEVT